MLHHYVYGRDVKYCPSCGSGSVVKRVRYPKGLYRCNSCGHVFRTPAVRNKKKVRKDTNKYISTH
ncbi:hypothetical protein [Methanosarcina siciliae]|uniref:hypothetical protein n=1 Tax=Methanosarcina siciliae TaxID=38027 RepID=UPI000B1B3903